MKIALPLVLVGMTAGLALADPMPPRMRQKEERLRLMAEEKKHANDKSPFEFSAPEGFTVTQKAEPAKPEPAKPSPAKAPPDFAATSVAPAATMSATVEKTAVTIDDALLAAEATKAADQFTAAHAGGSAKLVKKELVKIDGTPAARFVLDTRADGKKATKPLRELHYIVGSGVFRAHVTYAAAVPSFAKLEKKFDESFRKTKGLAPAATAQTGKAPEAKAPEAKPAP